MKLMDIAKLANEYGIDVTSMWVAGHQKFIGVCLSSCSHPYFVEIACDNVDHNELVMARNFKAALVKIAELKEQEGVRVTSQRSALVMGDIEPYKSQIDGRMIMSRSQHRTHLKDNNCIEIGNETSFLNKEQKGMQAPKGLKEELIQQVNAKLRYK